MDKIAERKHTRPPEGEEMPPEDPMPEPEMDAEGGEGVEISPEQAEVIIALGDMLKAAMPEMGGEELPPDEAAPEELPPEGGEEELPPEGEEEMLEAALAETDIEMSEEQVVQEVARRVAARILKAKKAKAALAEALGNKK